MIIDTKILILFAAVLAVITIGFKKYVWFISVGYGFAISAIGIALLILYGKTLPVWTICYCVVMTLYGFRLGGYLLYRETKAAYNNHMKGEITDGSKMPFGVKVALWLTCGLLYIMMMAPLIYRCANGTVSNTTGIVGMFITIFGILFEALSDLQKNAAKKKNPKLFCSQGLFKIVRCPNYLGEMIVWTGMFVSAFNNLQSVGQWIIAIIGYLGIIYIMFSGARRLEIRQDKNYGANPDYIKYKETTPILVPFVPLYSVKKHTWLVG